MYEKFQRPWLYSRTAGKKDSDTWLEETIFLKKETSNCHGIKMILQLQRMSALLNTPVLMCNKMRGAIFWQNFYCYQFISCD